MALQNYSNHVRYYTPHHFIFYPLVIAGMIASIRLYYTEQSQSLIWMAFTSLFILLGWLSYMMRQHYALVLQNRLVRLELRVRYFQLTQHRLEEVENSLSFRQIAALRFASDHELPALVDKTVKENLPPKQIKKHIKEWLPDTMRV